MKLLYIQRILFKNALLQICFTKNLDAEVHALQVHPGAVNLSSKRTLVFDLAYQDQGKYHAQKLSGKQVNKISEYKSSQAYHPPFVRCIVNL